MKIVKEIMLVFLGFGIGLSAFAWMTGSISLTYFYKYIILNGTAGLLLWAGNGYLADWLNIHYPWVKNTQKRLILTVISTVVYTFLAWFIIMCLWYILFKGHLPYVSDLQKFPIISFIGTLVFTLLISAFVHGSNFLAAWKEALIESERLKKDQIAAQYETLKNQVNPHFLFNSFNVLTTLVHKDADLAEQFVRQLSNVYRYVLDSRDKEIVPLDLELKELEAYIFLMKIRFGESLKATINTNNTEGVSVAPLTLQMLVENALKHNEVSKAHPLSIDVFQEGDYIIVKNNIQLKNSVGESTGVGLENIKSRYTFLTDKKVEISENKDYFIVKIPLI